MIAGYKSVLLKCSARMIIVRLCHEIKQKLKVAQDVINYLESSIEYKDLIDSMPKNLLKKYRTPETMYLINRKTAKDISNTLLGYVDKNAPLVEVNPGFGLLTQELVQWHKSPIYLYETSKHFKQIFNDIQEQNPTLINYKQADFFSIWKLAFQDKIDQGNRINELLGDLINKDKGSILNIIAAMPSLNFVRHLINTIVFDNTTSYLGMLDLYIVMPGYYYEFLTDNAIQKGKHKSIPALFQLMFDYKVLNKVPKVHYLPWTYPPSSKKISMMDEYSLYLVRITQKPNLPCLPEYLPLLWYFFKPYTLAKSTRVIPMFEQWIPGSGVWLITGQDPPHTNKQLSPDENDAKLPHMTIFTEFGDLSLQQKLTVFKRFISWPEFEQCPFRATMENHLQKFAAPVEYDDKTNTGSHNDDEIEVSDTEIEPNE